MPAYEFECQNCFWIFGDFLSLSEYDDKKKNNWMGIKCPQCGSFNVKRSFKMGFPAIKTKVSKEDALEDWRKWEIARTKASVKETQPVRDKLVRQQKTIDKRKEEFHDKGKQKHFKDKYREKLLRPHVEEIKKEIDEEWEEKGKKRNKEK